MLHAEQTATWGLSKSSSSNPTARSIERLGARSSPSTTMEEKFRLQLLMILIKIEGGEIIGLYERTRIQSYYLNFATFFFWKIQT